MNLKGMKVLVTGSDGFIGSHLVEALVKEGCDVRAFVYYNAFNSWGWLDSLDKKIVKAIDVYAGDVRDQSSVEEAMQGVGTVFHLAALIGIPFSYRSPESYVDTNIKGALHVLQAAKKLRTKKVLLTSTSEVYGTAKYVPIDESHTYQGQSPYSASKISADVIAESFIRSFGLPVTIVRPFNTYGPRQSARAVIPTIITQLLSGAEEIRLGSVDTTRDFVYVKDTAEGFVRIAKSDKTIGEVVNIATQSEISIYELSKKIAKLTGQKTIVVKDDKRVRPKKSEVERLLGCNKKLKRLTGWTPRYTLDEGLKETVRWFDNKDHLKRYKPDVYNI